MDKIIKELKKLKPVLNPHLSAEGGVAIRFEMLTYLKYAPLSKRFDALPSNTTWGFKATSILFINNIKNKIGNRQTKD